MQKLTIKDAESRLPEIINMAAEGEDVAIISEEGLTFKLILISKDKPYPKFGSAKGLIEMSDDFDEPLDDFKNYIPRKSYLFPIYKI